MKARHISFTGPNVPAMLAGWKTQTRRVVKPLTKRHPIVNLKDEGADNHVRSYSGKFNDPESWGFFAAEDGADMALADWVSFLCPYGEPGDLLYVKENAWMWCQKIPDGRTKTGRKKWRYEPMREAPVIYQADHPAKPTTNIVSPPGDWGWRLKIGRFLPRWASRLTLEITDVRVQRLQDISAEDARDEGVDQHSKDVRQMWLYGASREQIDAIYLRACIGEYQKVWESIHGSGTWDANPWVWAITFKVHKCNVDTFIKDESHE